MEASERQVVLILADISGYTRFMVENQLAAVHGQVVITFLIETMLKEVDIPLTLHGIEGDAVFLSASHPGTDEEWKGVLALVRTNLSRFFEVFLEGIVRMAESTPCDCPSCQNVNQLKLKIVVHSGRAVFHTIAGLAQIAGTDVIIVHRLMPRAKRVAKVDPRRRNLFDRSSADRIADDSPWHHRGSCPNGTRRVRRKDDRASSADKPRLPP